MPKLSKKMISTTAALGVGALIVVPLSIGIANSTKDHKYNNYSGKLNEHIADLALRKNSDKVPEILSATFEFGNSSVQIPHLKEWNDLEALEQSDDVKAKKAVITKEIDDKFESLRKQKGINPTIVIRTKIMTIKNDYFDMFGWGETTDFFDWFINNVSWGPELLTLREFDIVRGVSKDGSMITLGGHSGTRENTLIKFYPDSFFGVQNIYDGTKASILVDTSNLGLHSDKDVINSYTKDFTKILAKYKDKLFAKGFEDDQEISDNILNIKTIEDQIEVFDEDTLAKISANSLIEGSTSDKQQYSVDGGFPSLSEFLTYIHGKGSVVSQDTIKSSDGTTKTVYPKRYLRRILTVMYGYYSQVNLQQQDITRKKIEDNDLKYSEYQSKSNGSDYKINQIVDGSAEVSLTKGTKVIKDLSGGVLTEVKIQPYINSVEFKEDPGMTQIKNPKVSGDSLMGPLILSTFNNYSAELPYDVAEKIGKIIKQSTKMNVARTVVSANKDMEGKNKVLLLFEKYQNLIGTISDYKKEHNWAPISFSGGQPNLNEFIPNLYLYKYQNREHGFLDYAISNTKTFDTSEVRTAQYLQEEIKKYGIKFNNETLDINNPKTTRQPGDASVKSGLSSYDDDLAKVISDIPFGVDEPLVKKYFEYEARSKTKIKKIGIEWLKYVASHEYGHHQTLTYAKDISDGDKKPTERQTEAGIYDIQGEEITSGATINQHGFGDSYSRNYINEYLRSRGGIIPNLNPAQKTGEFKPLDQEVATMQIDPKATKDNPYFTFLFHNGGKNRFTTDETSKTAPVEKSVYSYGDFLNSWRAFKNPDQFLEALMIKPAELSKLRGKMDGESNIGYVAYLLNSLDESSYSLNPTIMAPIAPFSEGTNRLIDPMTSDPKEASKVNPLNIINGWTGYDGSDTSVAPDVVSLNVAEALGYKTTVYKNGASDGDSIADRLEKADDGSYFKYSISIPKAIAQNMVNTIKEVELGDSAKELFADKNILSPYAGGNPYSDVAQISGDVEAISSKFSADFRKATDIFVELDVDYSKGTPVYYKKGTAPAGTTVSTEKILISSTIFKSVPLVGITRNNIANVIETEYNKKYGTLKFDTATETDRYTFFEDFLIKQINQDDNRMLSANLPISQLADGKKTYSEWFDKTFGMDGIPDSQNSGFKKSYGEYLFQTYYKNFGRFLDAEKDYAQEPKKNVIVPTTYLVTALGTSKVKTNKLNTVYASFLSQGSYSFFGQLMADYQVNIAETINRDMNQLIYAPSTKLLQDGVSSEAYSGIDFSLPPIFTSEFGESGHIEFVPEIGSYEDTEKKIVLPNQKSGFFEDVALRRELDASIYMTDESEIQKYYEEEIDRINRLLAKPAESDDYKKGLKEEFKDANGNPITDPAKWRDVFDEYGHPLTHAGKAMVNFYKQTSGAVLDRDLSGFFVDKYTGLGQMYGYISKKDADEFDHIAFVSSTGKTEYIGITKNMSNQFFNKTLAVEGNGNKDKKVSIGEGYYDTDGNWIDYDPSDQQIGWASDKFLSDSYANALIKEGGSYKIYFTKGESLADKRFVKLGSVDTFSASVANPGTYGVTHEAREIMYNNGFDIYSGKFEITSKDGVTSIRVRRDNDE